MEIGDRVYIRRHKIYDKDIVMYQSGVIDGIYRHHILVKVECIKGKYYRESFFEYELKKEEELRENEHIF